MTTSNLGPAKKYHECKKISTSKVIRLKINPRIPTTAAPEIEIHH